MTISQGDKDLKAEIVFNYHIQQFKKSIFILSAKHSTIHPVRLDN